MPDEKTHAQAIDAFRAAVQDLVDDLTPMLGAERAKACADKIVASVIGRMKRDAGVVEH